MKKLKRLVAVLLVGIMALAMLTACGVTPSAPSMRDTALEESVAQWTVELGKNQNLTLTLDSELTEISNKCLPTAVKAVDARLAFPKDQNAYNDAVKKRETFFAEAKKGKAYVKSSYEAGKAETIETKNIDTFFSLAQMKRANVAKKAKFTALGVGAKTINGKTYVAIGFRVEG